MSEAPVMTSRSAWQRFVPALTSRWWTLLLGVSLMANLLIGGIAIGRYYTYGPPDRLMGASYVQLIPRGFFQGLPRERRKELMDIVRGNRNDLRELRRASEEAALELAEVLEKDDYAEEDAQAVVSTFSTGSESLAARGGAVVLEIVRKLTPEERKQLAAAIRARDAGRKRR